MSLDSTEQELFDFAWQSMPEWYRDRDRAQEEIAGFAKLFGAIKKTMAYWFDMCLVGVATGRELGDTGWLDAQSEASYGPDWLAMHAEDYGTRRMNGETDALIRQRLRMAPTAVTRTALIAAAQAIIDAAGVSGTVGMVEFPRDAAYLGSFVADTGTGGAFSKVGSTVTFLPTTAFAYPPYFDGLSGKVKESQIVISGSNSAGNDGTFPITGLSVANDNNGDPTRTAVTYVNANGVAETDATCSWETNRLSHKGAVMDGYARAFVNRGHRVWRGQSATGPLKAMGGVLLILPYGTTDVVRLSVREMLRKLKAAGFAGIVERRIGAP